MNRRSSPPRMPGSPTAPPAPPAMPAPQYQYPLVNAEKAAPKDGFTNTWAPAMPPAETRSNHEIVERLKRFQPPPSTHSNSDIIAELLASVPPAAGPAATSPTVRVPIARPARTQSAAPLFAARAGGRASRMLGSPVRPGQPAAASPPQSYKLAGAPAEPVNALYTAAANGHRSMVKLLLENVGLDPNAVGPADRGRTAMHAAAAAGHADVLRLLLEMPGADASGRDRDGRTALELATAAGHSSCVTALRGAGAGAGGGALAAPALRSSSGVGLPLRGGGGGGAPSSPHVPSITARALAAATASSPFAPPTARADGSYPNPYLKRTVRPRAHHSPRHSTPHSSQECIVLLYYPGLAGPNYFCVVGADD